VYCGEHLNCIFPSVLTYFKLAKLRIRDEDIGEIMAESDDLYEEELWSDCADDVESSYDSDYDPYEEELWSDSADNVEASDDSDCTPPTLP
jgi:hypothetical protein